MKEETKKELCEQLRSISDKVEDAIDALNEIDYLRCELYNTIANLPLTPVEYLTPVRYVVVHSQWLKTAEVQPHENQRVIVQTATGEQYFMTYPFSHTKYPLWWVIPQNNE